MNKQNCNESIEDLINKYLQYGWAKLSELFITNNKFGKEK